MNTEAYYNESTNTSFYYSNGVAIAKLDHTTDGFEAYEEMSEKDKDFYYEAMQKNREEHNAFDYDVVSEQNLYA